MTTNHSSPSWSDPANEAAREVLIDGRRWRPSLAARPAEVTTRPGGIRNRLEAGRGPHAVAVATTVVLAGLSPLRFSILVSRMEPAAYGYLSIFNTLTSLLPYVLALGLTLQFQLLAGSYGRAATSQLIRRGSAVVLVTALPGFGLCYVLALPFSSAGSPIVLAGFSIVTASAVALTITIAQILLGFRSRSASVLVMFGYNVFLTITVVPFLVWGPVTVSSVMGAWMVASLIGLGLAGWWLHSTRTPDAGDASRAAASVSRIRMRYADGLLTIPALVGPWLLVMLTRYFLGLFSTGSALATFALSWTLVDLAFLISVNIPMLASTEIMFGRRSPVSVFLVSGAALTVLTGAGYLALELFVGTFARSYEPSGLVTALMLGTGLARVAISSWLPRAVGLMKERAVSAIYVGSAMALAVGLVVWRPSSPVPYALSLSLAFVLVAIVQAFLLRGAVPGIRLPEPTGSE